MEIKEVIEQLKKCKMIIDRDKSGKRVDALTEAIKILESYKQDNADLTAAYMKGVQDERERIFNITRRG